MAPTGHRLLVLRGLAWTTVYRLFDAVVSFAAMLVLVRVIPPEEYGRVGAMVGMLSLLNAFSCGTFMSQALQLADNAEPDWTLHWSAGLYIQGGLSAMGHMLAGLCWLYPAYRPLAPLFHLAATGILLDWPSWLGAVMLRRAMDYQRLQVLNAVATLGGLAVTLSLGLAGGGAYAIVMGSNITRALPFGVDLLIVRRWRPGPGWWRWPDWRAYRPALRFGFQQAGSSVLRGARGALEAAVLPGAVGYVAIGLFNRAQALFATTAGRVGDIMAETIYPLMPRYAANQSVYPRQATLFVQIVCLVTLPSALYVGLEGAALSRLLYGERWVSADPLILPSALLGMAQLLFMTASGVLLAINRLKTCLVLDITVAGVTASAIAVAWTAGGMEAYAWAAAVGYLLAAAAALGAAAQLLIRGWARTVLAPPVVSSAVGGVVIVALETSWAAYPPIVRLCMSGAVYVLVVGFMLRGIFPGAMAVLLSRVPGGDRLRGWLRLRPVSAVNATP